MGVVRNPAAQDGGLHYPGNSAGPAYGTGYCDAQCPHDIKWINGEANMEVGHDDDVDDDNDDVGIKDWDGTSADSGVGKYGTCCVELDIWEANSISAAYTNHPCEITGEGVVVVVRGAA